MIIKIGEEAGRSYWHCSCCRARWVSGGSPELEHVCQFIDVGPGMELEKIIAPLGVPSCAACVQLKYKMNEWGPSECRRRIGVIVDDICSRVKLPLARITVRALVERAIARDENRLRKSVQNLERVL